MRLLRAASTASRMVLCLVVLCLALTPTGLAGDYTRKIAPADQAAARAAVLQKADFGGAQVKGGQLDPNESDAPDCASFDPDVSDLVVTGQALSRWSGSGFQFTSSVDILRSSGMVAVDWRRQVAPTQKVLACLRELTQRGLGTSGKVVSAARLRAPRIGDRTAAFRLVADIPTGSTTTKMIFDFLVVTEGRAEITVLAVAPYAARASFAAATERIGRLIAARLAAAA